MSTQRLCKRIKKLFESPKDVEYDQIKYILQNFGYTEHKGKGSHCVFRKKNEYPITIPKHKPLKRVYIREVIKMLKLEDWYENECIWLHETAIYRYNR